MSGPRSDEDLCAAAVIVVSDWQALIASVPGLANLDLGHSARRAAEHGFLALARSLIFFLCGGAEGRRFKNDVQPSDFLGSDWFPPDEEMDQRLRGRLAKMSKVSTHLSWDRLEDERAVIWPYGYLMEEVTWAMGLFIAKLPEGAKSTEIFTDARDRIASELKFGSYRGATHEYGPPRLGQQDRRGN